MILPPSLFDPELGILPPDPYIQQVLYVFRAIPFVNAPVTRPLVLSFCSAFGHVHSLRCIECQAELWATVGDLSDRHDLHEKLGEHVGLHLPAAYMEVRVVQYVQIN